MYLLQSKYWFTAFSPVTWDVITITTTPDQPTDSGSVAVVVVVVTVTTQNAIPYTCTANTLCFNFRRRAAASCSQPRRSRLCFQQQCFTAAVVLANSCVEKLHTFLLEFRLNECLSGKAIFRVIIIELPYGYAFFSGTICGQSQHDCRGSSRNANPNFKWLLNACMNGCNPKI